MSEHEPGWRPMTPAVATAGSGDTPTEQALYEVRRKIYPRSVTGAFASWRVWMVLATQAIFYGLPWFEWNGRQAVLFDLGARKFYLFGLVLWPQDVIYLTVLLVLSALHGSGGAALLRIRLPADGLHRNLHVDRAAYRRRPLCSHPP